MTPDRAWKNENACYLATKNPDSSLSFPFSIFFFFFNGKSSSAWRSSTETLTPRAFNACLKFWSFSESGGERGGSCATWLQSPLPWFITFSHLCGGVKSLGIHEVTLTINDTLWSGLLSLNNNLPIPSLSLFTKKSSTAAHWPEE